MSPRPGALRLAVAAFALVTGLILPNVAGAVYQCGDQKDDCQCGANDPYPCCDNGGNCTWWAWEAACCNWAVALPGWGNANQWVGNAQLNPNYEVLAKPVVGSIACRVSGTYGHVAWVTAVNGDSISVTEENCCGTCNYGLRTHDYQASYFDGGFIVRKGQCECSSGETQNEGCGNCGTHSRSCGGDCKWGGWGSCSGEGACAKGQTEEQSCGDCGKHSRTCSDSCQWGEFGTCTGVDPNGGNDACDTGLKGVCAAGTRKCVDGTISCKQTKQSSAEVCDKLDNNCDGQVDEGSICGASGSDSGVVDGGTKDAGAKKDGALTDSATKDSGQSSASDGSPPGLFNVEAKQDDGGCGCRTAPSESRAAWWAALPLVGLFARRRRRDCGRPCNAHDRYV